MTAPTAHTASVTATNADTQTKNNSYTDLGDYLTTLLTITHDLENKIEGEIKQYKKKTDAANQDEWYIYGRNGISYSNDKKHDQSDDKNYDTIHPKVKLTTRRRADSNYSSRGYTLAEINELEKLTNIHDIKKSCDFNKATQLYHPNMHKAQELAQKLAQLAGDEVTASADLQTQLNADSSNREAIQKLCGTFLSHLASLLKQIANRI